MASESKKSRTSGRPSKRPLTVYNLFYRYKRTMLVQACGQNSDIDRDEACRLIKIAPGLENYPPSLQNKIPKDHLDGARRTAIRRQLEHQLIPKVDKKRKHRKSEYGFKLSFLEMNTCISESWKRLDDFSKSVFQELAEDGRRENQRLLAEYKKNERAHTTSLSAKKRSSKSPTARVVKAPKIIKSAASTASFNIASVKESLIGFDCDMNMEPLPFEPSQFWDDNSLPSTCEGEMPMLIEYDEKLSSTGAFNAKRRHSLDSMDLGHCWDAKENEAGSSPTVVSDHSSDSEESFTSTKRITQAEPVKKKGLDAKEDTKLDAKMLEKKRLEEYKLSQWKRSQALQAANRAPKKPRKKWYAHSSIAKTVIIPKTKADDTDTKSSEKLAMSMAQETWKQFDSYLQVLDSTVETIQNWEMRKAEIRREMDDLNATTLYSSL